MRILSLAPETFFNVLYQFTAESPPHSLAFLSFEPGTLHLHVGFNSGKMLQFIMDPIHGSSKTILFSKQLGTSPVTFYKTVVRGMPALVALSTHPWLVYPLHKRLFLNPISYVHLDTISSYFSPQIPNGFVGIEGTSLR